MNKYFIITLLCLSTTSAAFAQEESRFKFYFTYRHSLGLRETNALWNDTKDLYGNSIAVKGMYTVSRLFDVGVGLADDELNPDFITFPLYASIHLTPFGDKKLFFYNDLGYSFLNTDASYHGLHEEFGVGYRYIFKKHFGLSVHAGYQFKTIDNILMRYPDGTIKDTPTKRQSLLIGIGFVF